MLSKGGYICLHIYFSRRLTQTDTDICLRDPPPLKLWQDKSAAAKAMAGQVRRR
jgi:hypothetical protein